MKKLLLIAPCLLLLGCQAPQTPDSPNTVNVGSISPENRGVADPVTSISDPANSNTIPHEPSAGTMGTPPQPIIIPSKVKRVDYSGYVDEKGVLYLPGTKYVVTDKEHWNAEALSNPQNVYLPPENAQMMPTTPGMESSAIAVDAASDPQTETNRRYLIDIDKVRITGLLRGTDESKAREMASPDESPIFDPNLGWVLVPNDVLNNSSPKPVPLPPEHSPIPPQPETPQKNSPTLNQTAPQQGGNIE